MHQLGSKYIMTPDPRSQKVKIQLFQNMVMLHNKLKGNAVLLCILAIYYTNKIKF